MKHALALCLSAALPLGAAAHGYVSAPESRAYLCKLGQNSQCGAIQYEPQSLEWLSGYPNGGPPDGRIASAALTQFGELDEQTATRWTKRSMAAGTQNFSWTLTANHVSRNFRYYITKPDWNPNLKLSRAAFESAPFCLKDAGMVQPPKQLTHSCTVPERSGYHLILAVWEIGDTVNSFYNVIDVQFNPGPPPTWAQVGTVFPSTDLAVGDSVATRVFNAQGEQPALQTRVSIASAQEGARNNWSFLLASRINAEQANLRAGAQGTPGQFAPVYGQNELWARAGSGIQRVELQITKAPPAADFQLTGPAAEHNLAPNGALDLSFGIAVTGQLAVQATVLDGSGASKGSVSVNLNNSSQTLTLPVRNALAGAHSLVVTGTPSGGGGVVQKTVALNFKSSSGGAYEHVYPANQASYKAGTRVLQPKNGQVYECRPFPYSGWCTIYSASNNAYEPGVGPHWREAWTER